MHNSRRILEGIKIGGNKYQTNRKHITELSMNKQCPDIQPTSKQWEKGWDFSPLSASSQFRSTICEKAYYIALCNSYKCNSRRWKTPNVITF